MPGKRTEIKGRRNIVLPCCNSLLYVHPTITAAAVMFICININPYRIIGNDSLND